jgi:extracellular matrix regulatory protein A
MVLLSIGFDNFVVAERITAVVGCTSAPVRRLIQEYRSKSRLLDATHGRRMRALILLDDGCLVASALTPETLARRLTRPDLTDDGVTRD